MEAAVIRESSPAGSATVEAEGCWERRGSAAEPGRGLALGILSADTKGPLFLPQPVGKGSGRCFLCDP